MTEEKRRGPRPVVGRARKLRREQTPAEAKLWACLRDRQLAGLKFRRQHPIGRYVVDFYCAARRLAVEIDGDSHAHQLAYDRERTAWLNQRGVRVIRFTNRDVLEHLEGVVEVVLGECDRSEVCPSPQPFPQRGEGARPRAEGGAPEWRGGGCA